MNKQKSSFHCLEVLFPLYHSTLCMEDREATCHSTCTPGLKDAINSKVKHAISAKVS